MKLRWLVFGMLCFAATLFSQTFESRIAAEKDSGALSQTQALVLEALRILDSRKLPEMYRLHEGELPKKSGFDVAFRIRKAWDRFSDDEKTLLRPLLYRPNLSDEYIAPTGRFKIHYTLSGTDAVAPDDYDSSGIPDYIEETAEAFDASYAAEVDRLGFQPPPNDLNVDGPQWDVYVENIGNAYGWTTTEYQIGFNPDRYTAYIEVDNNYTHTPTQGINGLRVTAAHEFHHMIQMGYIGRDDDNDGYFDDAFLMEATATYMEDVVFDWVNDYLYYLPTFFSSTNTAFDRSDGWREYGLCVWFHFLETRQGNRNQALWTWQELLDKAGMSAVSAALARGGFVLDEEMALFYGWNMMTGSRADTSRFYKEGLFYPQVRITVDAGLEADTTLSGQVTKTGVVYDRFTAAEGTVYTVALTNTNWTAEPSSDVFSLSVLRNGTGHWGTALDENTVVRLNGEDPEYWRGAAAVENSGQETGFFAFSASKVELDQEDLPSNFPNPFLPSEQASTSIPFRLEASGKVRVMISTMSGNTIRDESVTYGASGLVLYDWDGKDRDGHEVRSGVYVYAVVQGEHVIRRDKIAVVR